MKNLLTTILLLASFSVMAQSLIFTTATEREDNSPLGLSEIAGHNVYCGDATGNYTRSVFVAGATLPDTTILETALRPALVFGKNYCALTTVDIDQRESKYSTEFIANGNKALPKPAAIPANLVIEVTL